MNRVSLAVLGAALVSVSCTAVAAELPEARRLHSIDVFQLEYADDVQISPDGSRIVYVRVSHDIMTDRARRNLWMVNADGTNNRPLRSESRRTSARRAGRRTARASRTCRRPRAARSSTCAGWIRARPRCSPISSRRRTPSPGRPTASRSRSRSWCPRDKKPLAAPPPKPEGAHWAPPVKVIDSVIYRADGAGYLESGFQHVFVVSAEGGTPRQLTEGDFNDDGPLSFTPDSKHIVFSANRGADWERDPQEQRSVHASTSRRRSSRSSPRATARTIRRWCRRMARTSPTWASTTGCRATRSRICM